MGGCHTIAKMPPINPSIKPINNPPAAPNQLMIENTSIITPHVTWLFGLDFSLIAPTIIMIPQIMPKTPYIPPIPRANVVIKAPIAMTIIPPRITKIPPINERIYADPGY